jgi:hypothetical protein
MLIIILIINIFRIIGFIQKILMIINMIILKILIKLILGVSIGINLIICRHA